MGLLSYQLGKKGEAEARVYLEKKGFRIMEQNFHSQQGEIDIIAQDGELLVFVEVKNYSYRSYGSTYGSINKAKRQSLIHAAKIFLLRRCIKDVNCRFDLISIYHKRDGDHLISHLKNVFYVDQERRS